MLGVASGFGFGGFEATRDGNFVSIDGGGCLGIASVIIGMINKGGSVLGVGDGFLLLRIGLGGSNTSHFHQLLFNGHRDHAGDSEKLTDTITVRRY